MFHASGGRNLNPHLDDCCGFLFDLSCTSFFYTRNLLRLEALQLHLVLPRVCVGFETTAMLLENQSIIYNAAFQCMKI